MSDAIGGFTGKPLVAGKCNLCANEGTGNLGLFLCDSHTAVIIKEHGDGLNQRWHKEFRTTLLAQLREGVEGLLAYREVAGYGVRQDDNGRIISKDEVLALLEKGGE